MIFPKITALLAAFIGVLTIHMIIRIAKIRRAERVELENGSNNALHRAVRSHGNLVETAPLFLIMLGFTEGAGANIFFILILALLFAGSRIIHPIGLSGKKGTFKMRVYGMFGTISAYLATALLLIYHVIFML